ncbi:MAG: TIGR03862 family flavoprotein [Pseudomonadota bacterium]
MSQTVAIVGGGPAGLMAADAASALGAKVTIYDQMPSLARKFLMAGKSGLNITHTEEKARFLARYGDDPRVKAIVDAFDADAVRAFMAELGIAEHIGSTGRVFPVMMKASPLLRAWLKRLGERRVEVRTKHRLAGWNGATSLTFQTPEGEVTVAADAIVFACGGGSWRRLGSDGLWTEQFAKAGITPLPFAASNVGLRADWSEILKERFAGAPLKNVRFIAPDGTASRGEAVITERGLESGGIYPLAKRFEDGGTLTIDLKPDTRIEQLTARLAKQKPGQSLSNRLRKGAQLEGVKAALFREGPTHSDTTSPEAIATRIKALPIQITGTVPLDEAISTRGGVPWSALDERLMLKDAPSAYCAGEMIDWDAPTGGYLLTACLATGWLAGKTAA